MNPIDDLKFDEGIIDRPPESKKFSDTKLGSMLMGKIGMSIMCSLVAGIILRLPQIKTGILWVCHLVLVVCGKPSGAESVEEKIRTSMDRPGVPTVPAPPIPEAPPKPMDRLRAAAEEAKETADDAVKQVQMAPVVAVKEKAQEKVDEVKETVTEGAEKITDKLGAMHGNFAEGLEARRELAMERAEAAERDSIIARAAQHGIEWEGRPLDEVRTEVIAAEAESRPNARCPTCSYHFRLPPNVTEGKYKCPRCKKFYSVPAARQLGSAPPSFGIFGQRGGYR